MSVDRLPIEQQIVTVGLGPVQGEMEGWPLVAMLLLTVTIGPR